MKYLITVCAEVPLGAKVSKLISKCWRKILDLHVNLWVLVYDFFEKQPGVYVYARFEHMFEFNEKRKSWDKPSGRPAGYSQERSQKYREKRRGM